MAMIGTPLRDGSLPQPQRDLVSVEAGDVEVHEHEVGLERQGASHPFEPVGRVDHLVTVGGEELSDEKS